MAKSTFGAEILILLLLNVSFNIRGQESESARRISDSLFIESPALFITDIQFPENYCKGTPCPLVIGLHGGGATNDSFKRIWNHFDDPSFILATPQAPYKWLIDDKIGYDWSAWPTGDLEFMAKALELTVDYIVKVIRSVKEKYRISEVFLMGFSQGSMITQIAGVRYPNLINGMIILSGPPLYEPGWSPWTDSFNIDWPSKETLQAANNLKVFIAHGNSDPIIKIDLASSSMDLYEEFGFDATFFEFNGGHEINEEALKKIEKWIIK